MKQKENNSYIMNDLHAMDALHEHIAMVLYCTNSSAKSISMDPFHTVNFDKFAMVTIILPNTPINGSLNNLFIIYLNIK